MVGSINQILQSLGHSFRPALSIIHSSQKNYTHYIKFAVMQMAWKVSITGFFSPLSPSTVYGARHFMYLSILTGTQPAITHIHRLHMSAICCYLHMHFQMLVCMAGQVLKHMHGSHLSTGLHGAITED